MDDPKLIDESNAYIFSRFKSVIRKQQHIKVTVNSMPYEVSCEQKKIHCFCNTDARDKYHDKSTSYTTFQTKYVSLAKEEVKKERTDNQ